MSNKQTSVWDLRYICTCGIKKQPCRRHQVNAPEEETQPKCSECHEPCKAVEETFDYAGTHCTHGNTGTHHTGHYVSDCCFADLEDA